MSHNRNSSVSHLTDRVIVVGNGVVGLSIASQLAEAGFPVDIVARERPKNTVSAVAAAFWTPFHVEGARPSWARRTLDMFHQIESTEADEAGVHRVDGVEYFETAANYDSWMNETWWRDIPSVNFKLLPSVEVPKGFARGVGFTVPVVHMPRYLTWLERRVRELGVQIRCETVEDLNELSSCCSLVVNATGLGARTLVNDPLVYALLGQVVCIKPRPSIQQLIFCTTGRYAEQPVYVVPRRSDIILGGTTVEVPADGDYLPDPAVTRSIIDQCAEVLPELAHVSKGDIIAERVGLRPCRKRSVRIEADTSGRVPVIHAYGHGGGGVTFSWGTADEVVRLADDILGTATAHSAAN